MVGPNNERHWAIGDFSNIIPLKSFEVLDGFTDEHGTINKEMPQTVWKLNFEKSGNGTKVVITLLGPGSQLSKLVEMGFQEGFTLALENLDEVLASKTTAKK
jgi:PhnB protein